MIDFPRRLQGRSHCLFSPLKILACPAATSRLLRSARQRIPALICLLTRCIPASSAGQRPQRTRSRTGAAAEYHLLVAPADRGPYSAFWTSDSDLCTEHIAIQAPNTDRARAGLSRLSRWQHCCMLADGATRSDAFSEMSAGATFRDCERSPRS